MPLVNDQTEVRLLASESAEWSLAPVEKRLLEQLLVMTRPRTIVELGVYRAATSVFMCDVLEANGIDATVYGFDLPEVLERTCQENPKVNEWKRSGRLNLIPGSLPESLADWLTAQKYSVDFALVDATHNYPSVLGELRLLWPRLAQDGYILLDDYAERTDGVRHALDHFVSITPGAMAVPLIASTGASAAGVVCKLALLRRRPYGFRRGHWWTTHHFPSLKARALEMPVVATFWNWIRPLFRGSAE